MGLKSFLKPDWRKLVLPAAFIVMFLITLNSYYAFTDRFDKHACDVSRLFNQMSAYQRQNDTLNINRTIEELNSIGDDIQKESGGITNLDMAPLWNFMSSIDPINPVPCEISVSDFCQYYISERAFDCMNNKSSSGPFDLSSMFAEPPEYHRDPIFVPALNILLLFVEGYLISCAAIFGYDKIRSRKQKKSKPELKRLVPASSGYRKNTNT